MGLEHVFPASIMASFWGTCEISNEYMFMFKNNKKTHTESQNHPAPSGFLPPQTAPWMDQRWSSNLLISPFMEKGFSESGDVGSVFPPIFGGVTGGQES